jgi:hypothetical protein
LGQKIELVNLHLVLEADPAERSKNIRATEFLALATHSSKKEPFNKKTQRCHAGQAKKRKDEWRYMSNFGTSKRARQYAEPEGGRPFFRTARGPVIPYVGAWNVFRVTKRKKFREGEAIEIRER